MRDSLENAPEEPLASGRTAEVFDLGDGTVPKLRRAGLDRAMIGTEAANVPAVHPAGVSAPSFHRLVESEGRNGAIFDLVDGDLLLDEAVT